LFGLFRISAFSRVLRSHDPASSAMLFGSQAGGEGVAYSFNVWLRDVFEGIYLRCFLKESQR
jgi:hypothetical protein